MMTVDPLPLILSKVICGIENTFKATFYVTHVGILSLLRFQITLPPNVMPTPFSSKIVVPVTRNFNMTSYFHCFHSAGW